MPHQVAFAFLFSVLLPGELNSAKGRISGGFDVSIEKESSNMKAKQASEAATLEQIPNIGKAVAQDLRKIGITRPDQLIGKDGLQLYHKLNQDTGFRHDPCMADTLMAAVDFMNGGKAKSWWMFTAKRKTLLKD